MTRRSAGSRGRSSQVSRRRRGARKMTGADLNEDNLPDVEEEAHQLLDISQLKTLSHAEHADTDESVWAIAVQVFIPFVISGLGMVLAGLVLDEVQHWVVFKVVSEVFILVPALLGLKGNLEMTLASRLSTHANLGNMDSRQKQWSLIVGNMALTQCQATVVGFLASVVAMVMGWVPEGKFDVAHGLLLCASSVVTASLASFALGLVMIAVILSSRQCNINPDNIATPIAASLGDLTTLALLSGISMWLYNSIDTQPWLAPTIIGVFLVLTPVWIVIASRNTFTKEVLYTGWTPVISAMLISSVGGLILDFTVANFKGIAVFQPVINGVGGNLVAVQASRISTSLHRSSRLGKLPQHARTICLNPLEALCSRGGHARTARVLLMMVVPGHLIFTCTISYLQAGHTSITPIFVAVYLLAALLQVLLLLYICHVMVHWMWKKAIDPDNSAIPYLTAIGDFLGTGLLAIAFQFLYIIGDHDSDVGD
ncbi:solute carrier family 41 member 1-like [Schistocerca gregaria]|uniref:solute carrier family 41 member 1-like n=1 Tax=Schistocerca gregaria TaxID=7010 RepID=UPI00211F1BC6|nr:solute carrier family 41 member 1-like [Schistocerca gregaria]XP_049845630.1 solute carrier family 41 member 1-like [Schistocerca gregaria]XP_049845631.1 solute carrier family 41 member 1-like [Schistocerca gregaria]XP_049845632.1 solute carrier family 41 member 1-like [Schistocerca gregaria]XP_049845633.1 solute carrier family 41 member 1-like [Schistocerca gregaria]XP_049845634.1 solute carrier family 41 member 1-like [Schistocerca gregaria]